MCTALQGCEMSDRYLLGVGGVQKREFLTQSHAELLSRDTVRIVLFIQRHCHHFTMCAYLYFVNDKCNKIDMTFLFFEAVGAIFWIPSLVVLTDILLV